LAHQLTIFRRGEQVRAEFAAIASGGGGSPEVLAALADVIENPVVLEDHRGSLLYHASNGLDDRDVVAAWESRRESGSAGGLSLPCDSLGPGGHLIVLDLKSPSDEFDRIAAEHAAEIISLLLLRPQHQELLRASERGNFLTELLDGQLTPREARLRSDALGFNTSGQVLMPMAIALQRVSGEAHSRLWNALSRELESASYRSMLAVHPRLADSMLLVAIRNAEQRRQTAERLARLVGMVTGREAPGSPPPAIAVGAACDWTDLADQILEAVRTTEASAGLTPALWHDAAAPNLERLLWNIAKLPEVRRFAEETLRPLQVQDERRNTALIETLEVFCEHNGRKSAAAEALHLRRQALHYRLNRIEGVLGADLQDEDVRLGLHLAVRIRSYLEPKAPEK
jgi:purine catabolism regulator